MTRQREKHGQKRRGRSRRGHPPPLPPSAARALRQAVTAHRAGDLPSAEAGYRATLQHDPDQPDALHLLGVLRHQQGSQDEAIRLIRRALARQPDQAAFHLHLAEALLAAQRPDQALAACRHARALEPERPGLDSLEGDILQAAGRPAEAIAAYEAALRRDPGDAMLENNLGNALASAARPFAALSAYDRAIARDPGLHAAHENAMRTAEQLGLLDEALERARAAIATLGSSPAWRRRAAALCERIGDTGSGLAWLGDPGSTDTANETETDQARRAALLEGHGRPADAIAVCTENAATAAQPAEKARWWARAGTIQERRGNRAGAVDAYRAAVHADETSSAGWAGLVDAGASIEPEALEALIARPDPSAPDKAAIGFALGRLREQAGAFDEAFNAYRAANQRIAAERPFEPSRLSAYVDAVIATHPPQPHAAGTPSGDPTAREPIFIVGMPRCGSTLLERMLAGHPAVAAGGERNDIPQMAAELARHAGYERGFPAALAGLDATTRATLAARYGERTRALHERAARFTDKLLGNHLRLGLIRAVLPKARIIHVRREPLDTCVSCFTTHFQRGMAFTYDLERLAHAYREYQRVMAHWRAALPGGLLEVDYEALVTDPQATLQRVLDHLGLDWSPACLAFHRHEDPVATASRWQVRQPLYADSVGRWRRFEPHLGPLHPLAEQEPPPSRRQGDR